MTVSNRPVDNGVNTEALLQARETLMTAPEAAQFTWRAQCAWLRGTHTRTTVEGFSGLGEEHKHKSTFVFDADHPECFASEDLGATPVELALTALAACLTASLAAVAQNRNIQLESIATTVAGNMNILGILGADPDVRNGFEGVTIRFDIDADASRQDLEALVAQAQKRSAVFDVVTNPTHVTVEIA